MVLNFFFLWAVRMNSEERIGALKHMKEAVLLSWSEADVLVLQLLLDLLRAVFDIYFCNIFRRFFLYKSF